MSADPAYGLKHFQRRQFDAGEMPSFEDVATADRSRLVLLAGLCALNVRGNISTRALRDRVAVGLIKAYRVVHDLPEEY